MATQRRGSSFLKPRTAAIIILAIFLGVIALSIVVEMVENCECLQ